MHPLDVAPSTEYYCVSRRVVIAGAYSIVVGGMLKECEV